MTEQGLHLPYASCVAPIFSENSKTTVEFSIEEPTTSKQNETAKFCMAAGLFRWNIHHLTVLTA